jgi:TonB family protein
MRLGNHDLANLGYRSAATGVGLSVRRYKELRTSVFLSAGALFAFALWIIAPGECLAGDPGRTGANTPAQDAPSASGDGGNNSKLIDNATEAFSSFMTQAFEKLEAQKRERLAAQEKSKEFSAAVVHALDVTKPSVQGKPPGHVVVSFVISDTGKLENLKLDQSSGNTQTDRAALLAIEQTSMPIPPAGLPIRERSFRVEYVVN